MVPPGGGGLSGMLGEARIALALAGGNALGAYQAGVYQALHEGGVALHRVVGTSAGAINGAIIAGNAPAERLAKLEAFWRPNPAQGSRPAGREALPDSWRRTSEVVGTMLAGRSGLFAHLGSSIGSPTTPAIYDTAPMLASLNRLIDFARLNDGSVGYAAAAVDLASGEEVLFSTEAQRVHADHIRASAAMPPTFPAVPIDGRLFVDGGLSTNLPIDPILAAADERPALCIAVDLLPTAAPVPTTIGEVVARTQDLIFSSQSRRSIGHWRDLFAADDPSRARSMTLVRLAYADQGREVAGKAMDFSPASVRARWDAGRRDAAALVEALARGTVMIGGPGLVVSEGPFA